MDNYKNTELKIEEHSKKLAKVVKYGFVGWGIYVVCSFLFAVAVIGTIIHFIAKAW
jgi:hypothetical protein